MNKFLFGILIFCISNLSVAMPEYRESMKAYLKQGPSTSFNFEKMSLVTMANLLKSEKQVKVIYAPNVDTQQEIDMHLKNSNFLGFLYTTLRQRDLKYKVIDSRTIKIYRTSD